ncbi:Centrosomal protein [Amphibalanus amphitrite]|uniref:Centrosomal protein n=1 Tax=Amphibalanus amphitrite TaxID=1232801 RepID=A0A6A4VUE7_AMPAM|nr:Centrosomal protein [Amphibalanus amphitrite]
MATRIGYHAAFSTSEDHEHPAKELDQQGPHTRGWKSRQFCIYPQELAFKLASRTHVSKIQVLLHQLLIPEKIEFHIGDVERGKDESYANAKFTPLGSVTPSTNEESGHKAREVTAVNVDCEGLFVKLVIYKNHLNKSNRFNQDLTFNMYVDHDCVKYMQKLDARKAVAARNERFEYAKNCRDAVGLLHKAGLRLGKYHIEKRMAIEEESYDKAKLKKDHAEEYKEAVMEALRVDQLLESDGVDPKNNKTLNLELPPPPGKKKRPPTPPPEPSPPPRPKSDPLPPIPRTPDHRQNSSQRKLMAGLMVGDVGGSNPRQMSSILTDADRKAAALPIEVFGEPMVESFYSKSFIQKEEGFRNLMNSLRTEDDIRADKKTRAATFLLVRGLKDKMYTVCQQAVEALAYLTGPFANKHSLREHHPNRTSKRELSNTLEATVSELIQKLGENATRVQALASESLLQLANTAAGRGLPAVCDALAVPLRGSEYARLALARIDTLERNCRQTCPHFSSHVAEFAISALDQPSDQVRAAGSRLLVLIYPEHKRLVRSMLPSSGQVKNSSYRSLLAELDRIDGKRGVPSLRLDSPAELRAVPEDDEEEYEEEEEEEDSEEEDQYQRALRAEAEQEQREQEQERHQERHQEQEKPRPLAAENPTLSRSLRSKTMGAMLGHTSSEENGSTCVFCGATDDRFETEEGMEYHFWKSCPLLTRCKDCKQAVEVSEYTEHKLRDCKEHKNYRCCKRCQEAIPKGDYDYHVRSYQCIRKFNSGR